MKILLVCNLGMSSGILGKKLEDECASRGIEARVWAKPMNEIDDDLKEADVVLVSPQVRFIAKDLKKKTDENVKIVVMGPSEFGLQKTDVIMDNVLKEEG